MISAIWAVVVSMAVSNRIIPSPSSSSFVARKRHSEIWSIASSRSPADYMHYRFICGWSSCKLDQFFEDETDYTILEASEVLIIIITTAAIISIVVVVIIIIIIIKVPLILRPTHHVNSITVFVFDFSPDLVIHLLQGLRSFSF
jgi:hypothetical protein